MQIQACISKIRWTLRRWIEIPKEIGEFSRRLIFPLLQETGKPLTRKRLTDTETGEMIRVR